MPNSISAAALAFSLGNFGLDLGYVYYEYPDGAANGFGSFGEFYAKPSYKVADWLTIGAVIDGGTNFNNKVTLAPPWVGNADAGYYSGNAVITLPWHPVADVTLSINPEIGRQWFSSTVNANVGVASYTYWDVGLDINWKAITLDLRYWDTDARAWTTQCGLRPSTVTRAWTLATPASSRRSSSTPRSRLSNNLIDCLIGFYGRRLSMSRRPFYFAAARG